MYQRCQLGQDADIDWGAISPVEPEIPSLPQEVLTPAPWVGQLQPPSGLETPSAPPSASWTWSDVWGGVAPVIKTGAEAFTRIYGAIKGTGYPSPYPQTPSTRIPPGYALNPRTGRIERISAPTGGIIQSPYFWPVVLGAGAFFLVSARKK